MVVVAIVGVLAAVAVPAFMSYIRRAKASEVPQNLKALYTGASSYYVSERWARDLSGDEASTTHCVVGSAQPTTYAASSSKARADWDSESPSYSALGFATADLLYYEYIIETGAGSSACDQPPNSTEIYTFVAEGDLDGDKDRSRFELAVGSDSSNHLYHGLGIYSEDPME